MRNKAKVPILFPFRHQDPQGEFNGLGLNGKSQRGPFLAMLQILSGRLFLDDEIHQVPCRHALEIIAHLPATLFLSRV